MQQWHLRDDLAPLQFSTIDIQHHSFTALVRQRHGIHELLEDVEVALVFPAITHLLKRNQVSLLHLCESEERPCLEGEADCILLVRWPAPERVEALVAAVAHHYSWYLNDGCKRRARRRGGCQEEARHVGGEGYSRFDGRMSDLPLYLIALRASRGARADLGAFCLFHPCL